MRAASIAYNTKYCEAWSRCDPWSFLVNAGSITACIGADASVEDLANWFLHGSTLPPAALEACAQALDFSACKDFERFNSERIIPEACTSTAYGGLRDGAPCSVMTVSSVRHFNECASGFCAAPSPSSPPSAPGCGVCQPTTAIGDTCSVNDECPDGSVCFGPSTGPSSCEQFRELGDACDPVLALCHLELICKAGTCVTPPADGSCDPATACPTFPFFTACNPATNHCDSVVAGPGEPCGETPLGKLTPVLGYAPCVFGQSCTVPSGSSDKIGVCMPAIGNGEPCNSAEHPAGDGCTHTSFVYSLCDSTCTPLDDASCAAPDPPP